MPDYASKEYGCVDFMKLLCSYMVCILHMPVFVRRVGMYEVINFLLLNYLCRLAVPFFFLCSGYFLYRKIDSNPCMLSTLVKNYVFRLSRLYGFWMILLFVGDTGHLWYVKALVVSVILLFICLRMRFSFTIVLVIAAIFYCFGLILEPYHGILLPFADLPTIQFTEKAFHTIFGTVKNGFTFGFLFVSLGAMLAKKKPEIRIQHSLIGFVLSMLLLFVEVNILKK